MPGSDPDFEGHPFQGKPSAVIGRAIEDSGLVNEGDRGLVMVSGGADSVALLHGLHWMLGGQALIALHVNYGLRKEADSDEGLVADICERLGVELVVHKAGRPEGNVQAWARSVRFTEAERILEERDLDWIAVGHNRSDQAETFIYRLASSPGVRSLLAMPARSGTVIRPLLELDRDVIRRMIQPVSRFAEDATNDDISFARNRIRKQLITEMEAVNSGAELNIARTRAELEEDEEVLADLATGALGQAGYLPGQGLDGRELVRQPPAVRRRMLRLVTEEELGRPVAINRKIASDAARLVEEPEGGELELGGGDRLLIRRGRISVKSGGGTGGEEIPMPETVPLDGGTVRFGDWKIKSSVITRAEAGSGLGNRRMAFLDQESLLLWLIETSPGPDDLLLTVREWRHGDRVQPLGMEGSKKLQDVFTDALVPAENRRTWPVIAIGETVIWLPGLVRSRHLLLEAGSGPVIRLEATPPFPI
ncbi:MAG: tRNA lysidine(34) synthetase TilS [Solirubrobacterales bacterium]|nr:tRNA lysidine(34) synthetase TilS [Solirubrobacterales bacterium]